MHAQSETTLRIASLYFEVHAFTSAASDQLKVIVDNSLVNRPEMYLEGGDHASLVHVSGATFRELLADAQTARFARAA